MIDEPVFGIFLSDINNYLDSELMIGGYNEERMNNKDDLSWINLIKKDTWSVSLLNATYKEE